MNYIFIFLPAAALVGIVIELCTLPLRIRKLEQQTGPCLLALSRRTSPLFIGVVAVAVILPVIMFFRPFEIMYTAILCAVSVLGVEIVLREHVYNARNGVYENALIVDGRYMTRDDIVAFPELHYEKDDDNEEAESDDLYARALKVVSKQNGEFYVGFSNKEEKDEAVTILSQWGK